MRSIRLGLACLVTGLVWHHGSAVLAAEPMPHPGDGSVANGSYSDSYFDLSYPLPPGWTKGLAGPAPSSSGYYVLASLVPQGDLTGTILVTAQDVFFADPALGDAAEGARQLAEALAKVGGMRIDRQPAQVAIADRRFNRIDFSSVGLYRSTYFTTIRCHLVSFNFTAKSGEQLAGLVASLNMLGHDELADRRSVPVCVRNQATSENLVTKVDPAPGSPTFTPIPVRLVIRTDGSVKNVHVIRATPTQRDSIETALSQWKFRPYQINGLAAEIETGVVIEFRPAGTVAYLPGDRR